MIPMDCYITSPGGARRSVHSLYQAAKCIDKIHPGSFKSIYRNVCQAYHAGGAMVSGFLIEPDHRQRDKDDAIRQSRGRYRARRAAKRAADRACEQAWNAAGPHRWVTSLIRTQAKALWQSICSA